MQLPRRAPARARRWPRPSHLINADVYSELVRAAFAAAASSPTAPTATAATACVPVRVRASRFQAQPQPSAARSPATPNLSPMVANLALSDEHYALYLRYQSDAPRRRRHGPGQPRPVRPVPAAKQRSTRAWSSSASRTASCAWSRSSTCSPTACPRSTPSSTRRCQGAASAPTTSSGRSSRRATCGLPYVYLGLLDRAVPEDGLQDQFPPLEVLDNGRWLRHGSACDRGRAAAGRRNRPAATAAVPPMTDLRLLGAAYGIARPLLFRLDGERVHGLTLAAIAATRHGPACSPSLPARRSTTRSAARPALAQSASGSPPASTRMARHIDGLARSGSASSSWHGDAAGAARQPEAAAVPPAARAGAHQPHGLQQRRTRRSSSRNLEGAQSAARACSASTSARTPTRRSSAPPTITSSVCARSMRTPTT